jgi:ABC-type uncharacterized transport system substrate-binding protein
LKGALVAAGLAALAAAAGPAAAAEIALVLSIDVPAWRGAAEALQAAASDHNVTTYDLRGSRPEADKVLPGLKGSAAVVVAMGPLAAQAARELIADLPMVYCMVNDPAGVAFRAVNPKAARIGVVYGSPALNRQMEEAKRAASGLRQDLVLRQVASMQGVPQAVRDLLGGPEAVDALWIPADPLVLGDETRRFVMQAAVQAGKPVYGSSAAMVKEGALVSNSPEIASIGQSVGDLVNRIARGEKAGKLAVVVPRSEVVINKKMADQLGLAIPDAALKAAQRVF